ncbi:RCC1 domain-containing protein [Chryseobacterium geocarposphaerae]|uniref:DUF8202 domain-containing protein n=1 Tax=Chryseobacterium geocarposphaerae TaxID=1416776 RepID=A0A2M9C6Y5_9FLAO|nr:hypothetical protein [Chryseobacterium geocarposphaerae]PJJ66597.1 hypothetical protein CLV73_0586 [Chryseobacterium geocarposphaerae]
MKKQNLFLIVLLFLGNMIIYAQCSVNAGGNATICGTSYTLQGTSSGSTSGTPVWTLVSKPSGAPDPVFSNVNSLTPNVTGMTFPGNYVFQVAQNCSPSGTVTSQVTITAPGDVSTFTAGPDITGIPATTGVATLNATIPAGYTASWTYYNIFSYEFNGNVNTNNAIMSNTTTATPTLTLTNKSDHTIDPAYRAVLRITSINNSSCWYEDDAIVRFTPNPDMVFPTTYNQCIAPGTTGASFYYDASSTSPKFSTSTTNSSGNTSFGTTVTMAVVSQPAGGNIQYSRMENGRLYFSGITATGSYVFDLTISNSIGSFTKRLTYNFNGYQPNAITFVDPAYPNQTELYSAGSSGGVVFCNMAGSTSPITFYYKLNSADPPTLTDVVASSGTIPAGGAPSIVQGGAGTANRSVTLTPPSGGWRVGTYRFSITLSAAGGCTRQHLFYVHISDNARPAVNVDNITVCYPGSGVVSATVPLPAAYIAPTSNPSYLQGYGGRYDFTVVSTPAGAAAPTFEATSFRTLTSTSTVISNLNKEGEYVFKIKAIGNGSGKILTDEYACSGTSLEDTFSVFVSAQVGANAGSAQTLVGTTQTTFNGNNPGVATGTWTLLTKPAGATDPVIATPSAYNTNVTGFNTPGTYTFRWTVTTGTCNSTSDLTVNVMTAAAGGVAGADFWVKSDDAGTIATAWKDQSVNADDIPNVGGITLSPADRAHNFHPYTTGYSASKYFYNTNSDLNSTNNYLDPSMRSSVSVFSAVRPTSANGTGRITGIDDDANASEPGISINSGNPHIYKYFGNGGPQANSNTMSAANAFTVNKTSVFSAIQDQALNSGAGERRLGLDGIYETFNLGTTTNTFNVLGKHLKIGYAGWDSPGAFPGDIMEVLWFKRALTTNEQSRVNSYLAVKNGTTLNENYLSTASNVVWDITNNTGYNNNIFGIARDNITALHQKQSGSVNDAQKLVISTTGFADSNAANSAGLANDLQYLMAGDNGLKQSLTIPLAYAAGSNGTTNYRFESIWKAQNTGNVGTVTVAWPKGVKNLYLVQSPDAAFDGTDTFTPMVTEVTVNGVVYNTANVTLSNGQYFTFAGYMYAPGGVFSAAWYRADAANTLFSDAGTTNATDASTVQQWNEFNGKPFPLSQATVTLRPEFSNATTLVNFNPTVNYTTANKWLQYDGNTLGNIIDRSTGTLFSAGSTTGTTAFFGFGVSGATNTMDDPGLYNFTGNKFLFYPILGEYDPVSTYTINGPYIGGGTWQNGAGVGGNNAVDITLNGFHQTYNTNISNVNIAANRNALMAGGAETSVAFQQNEMIVFPTKLTDVEVNKVESYLAVKYGQTLSKEQNRNYLNSTGAVVWDGSVIDYYNNVFGIARDDISALHQKQSRSINDGQKLIIGAGSSLTNTNAANTNSLAEGQFLMTGDNGLFQGLKTPLAYTAGSNGATNYRFESIWKVQNTGSVGSVTVAWPKGVKNLYLVQSPDAVFDGTDTFTPMITEVTVNGVVYNTANVTLGNGQFFTFAGFGNAPGGVANGLSYWYRADKNVANTGAATDVTGWTDVWNGTTVAQLGTNTLPKYVLGASNYFNFNPGINFTANTQTLGNNTVRTLTSLNYDVFTFTKEGLTGSGFPRLFSTGMDNTTTNDQNWDGFGIWPASTNLERRPYGGGTQYPAVAPAFSATIPSIMYFRNTNTATSKGLNGAAMATATNFNAVGNMFGGHIFGDTRFSSNGSDNSGFTGHIGETIVYGAGTLSDIERRRVDSYLAIKYGITLGQVNTDHYLDTDGNIVWNGTTNTTYNNNIFGVGRDDIEILEQKVSKSVNAGTILTVATTNDFINPNQDAARTGFTNDKTYLVLGDNNNTNLAVNSITVNGYTGASRIQRQWLAQPTNAVGTVNFGVDLSSYGAGFGSGDHVKMIVADDAAFTANVVYVSGAYDATSGKWVHPYSFAAGQNKYITYVTVDETSCTTGCNDNAYLTASDPNTIEYDNIVASEVATIAKQKDGSFYIWGYGVSPNVSASNSNVVLNLLTPTKIDPATSLSGSGSGFNYTGTPLRVTTNGGNTSGVDALVMLTTDGLYTWGHAILPLNLRSTGDLRFGKQSVNGKADGLPPGVSPTNVKMMVANQGSLTITTCSGAVWNYNSGYYGDNAPVSTANSTRWHRVMKSATQTLDNVVAVRGIWNTKFALTSDGKLYTWGASTFHGDGTNVIVSNYATEVIVPTGITPKMIGMTEGVNEGESSYYLLSTTGKLFAMGYNGQKQLGDGTSTDRTSWVEITATDTDANSVTHSLGGNIAWISPAEHTNDYPSINVLTTDGKQWGWGYNLRQQLGGVSNTSGIVPRYMPGNGTSANQLSLNDKVIAVEDGGYHIINFKEGSTEYGFIGLKTNGSMGDGSSTGATLNTYTYVSPLDLCGIAVSGLCYKPGILTGTALDTKMGITALNRAGTNSDNWPMVRKGGWLALESKTKAFVPNRVAFSAGNPVGIAPANFVEGMMVYDTTNKCMKMYTSTDNGATFGWYCISTQTCPD